MNILPINSYRFTSFGSEEPENKPKKNNTLKTVGITAAAFSTVAGAVGLVMAPSLTNDVLVLNNNNNTSEPPESAYVETVVTSDKLITSIPKEQRDAVWHEVKKGDTLADIVIEYAQLSPSAKPDELLPYYHILEADNPGKWTDRDLIMAGTSFRVDGILPENIVVLDEKAFEGTRPVDDNQVSSSTDRVQVNGNIFSFDEGTMDRNFWGDFEGLMSGRFAYIDLKIQKGMILKKYEGVTSDTNLAQKIRYNEDGRIVEFTDYRDDKPVRVYSYEYREDSTIETVKDKSAASNQIGTIVSDFDAVEDFVNSRQFIVGNDIVANFDFNKKSVQIGSNVWNLDEFKCDDDKIGSSRYTGTINGQKVRFDVLRNGFCVEYLDNDGEIQSREQYDIDGVLILSE